MSILACCLVSRARAELPFGVMCVGPTARSVPLNISATSAGREAGGVAVFRWPSSWSGDFNAH